MGKSRVGLFTAPTLTWLLLILVFMGVHGVMGFFDHPSPPDRWRSDTPKIERLQVAIGILTAENFVLRNRTTEMEQNLGSCNALREGGIQRCIKNMEALLKENPTNKYRGKEAGEALARCESLDFIDYSGNTALHRAVLRQDEQSLQIILVGGGLERDSKINAKNGHLETPIMLAANGEDLTAAIRIIKYLAGNGANLYSNDGTGQTFLHKLVSRPELFTTAKAFRSLTEYIAEQNSTNLFNIRDNVYERTPLMLAIKSGEIHPDTLSFMRRNGVDLSLRDTGGESALSYYFEGTTTNKNYSNLEDAIQAGDENAVKVLVILGADVNAKNGQSETALHKAATAVDKAFAVKIIKFLIENGAEPLAVDKKGSTFLHRFVDDDEVKLSPPQFHDMAAFLLSKNASSIFNVQEKAVKELKLARASWTFSKSTALQLAVKNMEVENGTLSLLKNGGVDFNIGNDDGETLLFYAVAGERSTRLLADLVAHGADPQHRNKWDDSLLHWSALMGNVEQLKFCLDLGELDIDARDKINGRTPLHRAVFNGKGDVLGKVRLLIDNGANVKTKHRWGESPLDSALKSGNLPDKENIVQLLRGNKDKQ